MKNLILVNLMALLFVACSGGGNGNGYSGGGVDYTHNELAEVFVNKLNLDADFNVSLVKDSTLEKNFIVIYDPYTDSYDAINIDNYDPVNGNAVSYYNTNSGKNFFDLDVIPSHYEVEWRYETIYYDADGYAVRDYVAYDVLIPTRYRDRHSGLVFEKTGSSVKDLAKVAALKEAATLDKKAKFLSSEFGLSLDRGQEVARLAAHWKKASMKGMTDAEQDSFSTELLGFSITAGKKAAKEFIQGNSSSLDVLVQEAAATNGITPEHATKLMSKMIGM